MPDDDGYFGDVIAAGYDNTEAAMFGTIMNPTAQAAQVACFRNAADHLEPGGCFAIEVMVPQLRCLPPGRTIVPFQASEDSWGLDIYDVANQGLISRHFSIRNGATETRATPFRYVWPAELDLMAQFAGLQFRDRWADWSTEPFTSESSKYISVWQKEERNSKG